nr:hypothetical protein [Tanacetum cinerariifolium]
MGRDTIQLENAVSTISQEYLLEFTSEYGILESLHPELPGPEDPIVEFLEGKVDEKVFPTIMDWHTNAQKDEMPFAESYSAVVVATLNTHMDLFNLISAPNPTKISLDFADEDPPSVITKRGKEATAKAILESGPKKEATAIGPVMNKRRHNRGNKGAEANTPPKVLRKDHVASRPSHSTLGGKSLAAIEIEADSTGFAPATQETPVNVSDLDPLSYAEPRLIPEQDIAPSSKRTLVAEDPDSEKSTSFTSMVGSPGSIYQPGWGVTNNCRLDTPYSTTRLRLRFEQEAKLLKKAIAQVVRRDQRIEAREKHIKNLEALLESESDIKVEVEAKNVELAKELEILRVEFSDLQISNDQLSQQDDRVTSRCAEIDARLDALSKDFDEELYPHMLTVIAGRRWVIRHGLRLAVMKCAESTELRQVFVDVVSAEIAKGMSEGLKHGVEHEKAKVDLAGIEAYDPEADTKYVTALHALKDLKYPLVDQLEKLKDAPIDVIMASLFLKSDSGEDTPQWIRELQEILLEDAIAANISRAEKKKKCRVVCRTHEVGFAHHTRSDVILVSVPTIAPQGLAILLADAVT